MSSGSFVLVTHERFQLHVLLLSPINVTTPSRFTAGSNMARTEPLNEEAVPHSDKPQGPKA